MYVVIGVRFWLSALIVCLLHDNYQLALILGAFVLTAYVRAWCLEEIDKDIRSMDAEKPPTSL